MAIPPRGAPCLGTFPDASSALRTSGSRSFRARTVLLIIPQEKTEILYTAPLPSKIPDFGAQGMLNGEMTIWFGNEKVPMKETEPGLLDGKVYCGCITDDFYKPEEKLFEEVKTKNRGEL